jgi:hypothetical protein
VGVNQKPFHEPLDGVMENVSGLGNKARAGHETPRGVEVDARLSLSKNCGAFF